MRPSRTLASGAPAGAVPMLMLEPRDSAYYARIEHASHEVGLPVEHLEAIEGAPSDAALVGVGPSVPDPLQVARQIRHIGGQPLLVFFAASRSKRDALQAELVRDPFLCRRYELIEVPANPQQLATRMGGIVAHVKRQAHGSDASRRRRPRSNGSAGRSRQLRGSEDYLANILAQASDAMFSTDSAGRILTWNQAAERQFGIDAKGALGSALSLLDTPDASVDQLGALAGRVLASGQPEHAEVACRAGDDNKSILVMASVAPIRKAQGTVLGLSIITRDDSVHRRVEEALADATRQKDEFLAIMSHELRTPLTSILGYTDMLLRGLSGPLAPLTNKYVGNVRAAGDQLLQLVNGLLDYTRLEAGVERVDMRPVDLASIVGHSVEYFRGQAQSRTIDLRVEVAQDVGGVEADEDKLKHVLHSFLGNALKFTPVGGWVEVQVRPDLEATSAVRVSVADSGIGLRDDQLEHVWERFYQGDASLTRPYGGMGLGLSIARHLVTLHGGSVGVGSRGPDMGSTFWFSLPLRPKS